MRRWMPPNIKIMLATYFGAVGDNLATLASPARAPVFMSTLVRAPSNLTVVRRTHCLGDRFLSLGVVNGRNIWKTALTGAEHLVRGRPEKLRRRRSADDRA